MTIFLQENHGPPDEWHFIITTKPKKQADLYSLSLALLHIIIIIQRSLSHPLYLWMGSASQANLLLQRQLKGTHTYLYV